MNGAAGPHRPAVGRQNQGCTFLFGVANTGVTGSSRP